MYSTHKSAPQTPSCTVLSKLVGPSQVLRKGPQQQNIGTAWRMPADPHLLSRPNNWPIPLRTPISNVDPWVAMMRCRPIAAFVRATGRVANVAEPSRRASPPRNAAARAPLPSQRQAHNTTSRELGRLTSDTCCQPHHDTLRARTPAVGYRTRSCIFYGTRASIVNKLAYKGATPATTDSSLEEREILQYIC